MTVPSQRDPAAHPVTTGPDHDASAPTVFGPTEVDPAALSGLAPDKLEVTTTVDAPASTVTVRGELLQETAPVFTEAVAELVDDARVQRVLVDLSSTSFMDSTGLGTLVSLRNQILVRGGQFSLVRPPDRVFRLFELTRLDSVFDFVLVD